MDRQNGQQRLVQGPRHTGEGAQTQPPDAGRLRPLAPIRPLTVYPPNEPYGRRTPAPARPIPTPAGATPAPTAWAGQPYGQGTTPPQGAAPAWPDLTPRSQPLTTLRPKARRAAHSLTAHPGSP